MENFVRLLVDVCMDQMMIKLDKSYPLGTKVTLIGRDKTNEITRQMLLIGVER